jgi:acyl-coenzyme A synthetase/AMP-(fatty) acid ligase
VKPVAYVVLREDIHGTAELAAELQQFVRTRLPEYKRPRWVEFVPQLPKTATGKIQRFKLREAAEEASRPYDGSAAPGRNVQSHAPANRGGPRNAGA